MARTRHQGADQGLPLRDLPAAALRAVLREGYTRHDLKADVLAGLVVGVVALPLAMALAIGVGVPPQHGLYTAIVAGFLVAALGGSRNQVTGPTAAFIVVLAPIYTKFGLAGLLLSGILGGLILIAMGVFRLGRMIQFVPHPVTTGFTAGIATVIATMQLRDVFGLKPQGNPEHYIDKVQALFAARHTAALPEFLIALLTLGALLGVPKLTRRVPAPLVAFPLAALVAAALQRWVPSFGVATIASSFHTEINGHIFNGIPQLPPTPALPWLQPGPSGQALQPSFDTLRALLPGAFAIAILGAIESLLSAVVADGMAHTKHDPDAELISQGVGNVVAPLFGGIPATGAIARTATNIKAGGRTPVAAMVHSLTILIAVLALAPLLGYLPMASLAALLLLVAWNMSDAKHFVHILRVAPKSDVAVLLTCYGLTVTFDMVVGVSVGMVLAALLFMRRMAEVTETQLAGPERLSFQGKLPKDVVIYEISGPLFFGAAQKAMAALQVVSGKTRAVILLMPQVHAMDATGLVALESVLDSLHLRGCRALLTDVQAQPLGVLKRAHVFDLPGVTLCATTAEAVALLNSEGALPAEAGSPA